MLVWALLLSPRAAMSWGRRTLVDQRHGNTHEERVDREEGH